MGWGGLSGFSGLSWPSGLNGLELLGHFFLTSYALQEECEKKSSAELLVDFSADFIYFEGIYCLSLLWGSCFTPFLISYTHSEEYDQKYSVKLRVNFHTDFIHFQQGI